ncbi:MAG: RsmE family RNA methyltransferase [Bryobacteraceae bacterium]
MARRRFFVPSLRHGLAELTGDDAHHLTRVLRVEAGQRYEIVSGGAVYLGEVEEARKSRVVFRAIEAVEPHPLPVRVTLFFALIKFDRLELLLEKGTEAGVERFVPVIAERSERGLERAVEKRKSRWERIVLESAQQSRRDAVPVISDPMPFRRCASRVECDPAAGARLLLDESRDAPPLLAVFPGRLDRGEDIPCVELLLGPEGGWTEAEREFAIGEGWRPVSLGPQILRSETAAVVSVSLTIAAWVGGRFSGAGPGEASTM